jgi:hypothetical protein
MAAAQKLDVPANVHLALHTGWGSWDDKPCSSCYYFRVALCSSALFVKIKTTFTLLPDVLLPTLIEE